MNPRASQTPSLHEDTTALLAHDLKSPLSAMTMNLEFALSELPDTPPCESVREALADCRAAGARLQRMIANLLDVARSESGRLVPQLQETSPREVLGAAVNEYASEAEVRGVHLEADAGDVPVELDPDMVGRALAGMLDGAMRVTRAGDTMRLRAEHAPDELRLHIESDRALPIDMQRADTRVAWRFARAAAAAHGGHFEETARGYALVLPHRPT